MTTTFEAVCMILNEISFTIRTKHNLTEPDLLDIRIAYEDCDGIVLKALTDFITSYAEGKYGEGS